MTFSTKLYSGKKVKQLDKLAIGQAHIPAFELMTRAATVAFEVIRERWPLAKRFAVICGPGNNGGDGYVLAKMLHEDGFQVEVYSLDQLAPTSDTAKLAYIDFMPTGIKVKAIPSRLEHVDLIIDALLGIGFSSPMKPEYLSAVQLMNHSAQPILALDVPSGLDCDTGSVVDAVKATVTVTFVGNKFALYTGKARNVTGEVIFHPLDIPDEVYQAVEWDGEFLAYQEAQNALRPREPAAHKGCFGHVVILGGGALSYTGAVALAGKAAIVSGAGLVSAIVHPEAIPLMSRAPVELMCYPGNEQADSVWAKATVWLAGPGLTQSVWAEESFKRALGFNKPMVIDADGLHLLAKNSNQLKSDSWVLTPHPGEAASLLGLSVEEVEHNRVEAAKKLQARYGGVVVLKGAGTLICSTHQAFYLCTAGNPGMATGGMGDVLAGIIAGLMAQGLSPLDAAKLGVAVHALAGDLEQSFGERGMTASDLLLHSRNLLNPVQNHETEYTSTITPFFNFE